MDTELVFVEDELEMAESFFSHLNLKDKIRSVKYLENLDQTKKLISTKGFNRLYWVDIRLGKGKHREEEGIEVIRTIRESEPDALIIVYSAHPSKKNACFEAGADLFFEKDPSTYEHDIMQIRRLISLAINEMKLKEEPWEKTFNMYSQIVDIDVERNLVRLNCKLKKDSKETYERVLPLTCFKDKEKLSVDQSILIKVLERPGELRYLIKEVDGNYFNEDEVDIDVSDLENSPIFQKI